MEKHTTVALAEKFMQLFAGLDRAYGTYDLSRATTLENNKVQGLAITKTAPVTLELWERHLAGKGDGLGIVPIRDGNTCIFGVIDVDTYPLDLRAIVAKLRQHNIPMLVIRSKSGGAHIYIFTKRPVSAVKMKSKLGEVASFLGYGNCEIFPKQTQLLTDKGDTGNWINMPYFNGTRGMRYALDIDGNALSPEAFLIAAEALSVEESWFNELLVLASEFDDGPPCLQALSQIGYPVGTRNDGLYNIGVYLKRSKPDSWETALDEFNHKYLNPPLTMPEVQGVIKSVRRKDYNYGCSKQPIAQHCNAALCRTKRFGVGSGMNGRFPQLGGLTMLDTKPPIWFWTVEGVRMELSTSEIQDPRAFQRKCVDYLRIFPQLPSAPVWQAAVQHALDTVTIVEAPSDASPEGQFWEMVEKFCIGRAQALNIDEITMGKPFTEKGRTYFRMQDMIAFFSRNKFFEFKGPKIASLFKDSGAEHHVKNIKGRTVNYWSIPSFATQTSGFNPPEEVSGPSEPF